MSQEFDSKQQDNIAADVDEVMRKYDRESNTRIWTGWQKIVVKVLMVAFALYCIAMTLFSKAMAEIRLPLFMGFIVIAGFLNFPVSKKHVRPNHMPWYDFVLMIIGAGCFFYFAINAMTLIRLSTRIQPIHVVIGCVGILVLIELCRRCVGLPILFVLGALLIGALTAWAQRCGAVSAHTMLLLKVGVCGGFTTFSTFALETEQLLQAGRGGAAALYAALSVGLCVLAVFAGQGLVRPYSG